MQQSPRKAFAKERLFCWLACSRIEGVPYQIALLIFPGIKEALREQVDSRAFLGFKGESSLKGGRARSAAYNQVPFGIPC